MPEENFFSMYWKKKRRYKRSPNQEFAFQYFTRGREKKSGWKYEGKIRGYVRGFSLYPDGKIEDDAWIFRFRDTIWYINI